MTYLQPGFLFPPSPPPRWSLSAPPPSPWRPLLSPPSNGKSSSGGVVYGLVIAFVASVFAFAIVFSLCQGYRNSRAATAAAVAAEAAARPRPPPRPRDEEVQIRSRASDARPRRASPTAGLPAFTYSRSVKHNVTSGGEEVAATCSVCLGAFQLGETVRLLPVCLHLYHVECIDPWLAEHSTCPLCRSDTDPTMDVGRLPVAACLAMHARLLELILLYEEI